MQALQSTSYLSGGSAEYLEELYEKYLQDPASVDAQWRKYFSGLSPSQDVSHAEIRAHFQQLAQQKFAAPSIAGDALHERKQAQVMQLINAFRCYGHYQAKLDPLDLAKHLPMPELNLSFYQLEQADLNTTFSTFGALGLQTASLQQIYDGLKAVYCNTIGFEYQYIPERQQRDWLQQRIESNQGQLTFSKEERKRILLQLTQAEGLEKYLGAKFVAQKRFSLEGGDSLIPMLDELIHRSGAQQVQEVIMGMAHRGRLNVLINILGKAPTDLFQEFEGKYANTEFSGDVKYHKGYSSDIKINNEVIHVTLGFNPSHLEIIDPVIEGSVRARQQRRDDSERSRVIPILIHGDAAFAGQGVIMETFNLSQTRGYATGGTIHIVINNQVGFTTSNPEDARSTWYCTDIAKMVDAPVFHVNGDDPEAVLFVTRLAFDFRMAFKKDVVIDLVCYRRFGHNEADEPAATQPLMYQKIRSYPTTRKLYADRLISQEVVSEQEVDALNKNYRDILDAGRFVIETLNGTHKDPFAINWKPYLNQEWTAPAKTAVELKQLKRLADKLETLPADLTLQPQVAKMVEDRRKMTIGELPLNWGYAETLAYASLLADGYAVRISGQDSGRGTFFHRHAVLHNFKTGGAYIPLAHIANKSGQFCVIDSTLSEAAVMGFEYGYASSSPETLVIWEAQYGDFANGAQVVVDQFLSSSEQKWGRLCGLVLFLPHGYEGAGPEHSSARLERYLQLCAQNNMQVCVPTTPAQVFHMLRRQMVRPYRKPLIVMSPKSLLRHKLAVSNLQELATGQFQTVIPEVDDIKPASVKRVVLCSGKVFYDLLERRRESKQKEVAIVRIEQLYPFPKADLIAELQQYKKAQEIIWCQEEPKNQGAWYSINHSLQACVGNDQTLAYVGRKAAAAPAVGSPLLHHEQQKQLVEDALGLSK